MQQGCPNRAKSNLGQKIKIQVHFVIQGQNESGATLKNETLKKREKRKTPVAHKILQELPRLYSEAYFKVSVFPKSNENM